MSGARQATSLFRAAVVVPTFDHGRRLPALLEAVALLGVPTVVVDDGSRDDTPALLQAWMAAGGGAPRAVRTHSRNRGKGEALRTGFEAAATLGATHAVTIDADGQLDASDIPRLLDVARANPRALVLGRRPERIDGQPGRCAVGRWCANLAIRGESGVRISDSQCGLRVYPVDLVHAVRCVDRRFAFEAETITRAAWAGFPIVEVPVACRYFSPGERVSHFRPVRDSLRQILLHAVLSLRSLIPWPHRVHVRRSSAAPSESRLRQLGRWLDPVRCWRDSCAGPLGRLELAAALGFGVWIGTVPMFGAQTALCLYVAWRLHLHPAAVLLGSLVSLPPVGSAVATASVWVGNVLLTGRAGGVNFDSSDAPSFAFYRLPAWTVGGLVVGLLMGLGVFAMVALMARRVPAVSTAR